MSQVSYKQEFIARARRVVVKIGSAVVSDAGGLRPEIIARLAAEIDTIVRAGREVVVVTSGAIVAGRARLEKLGGAGVAARQAAAATGQIELMGEWARAFGAVGRTVAQLLLTHQDLAERARRTNAIHTIQTLLEAGVMPIVNENDTVAVEEIRMGDNDVLSSLVAGMAQAQLLVIRATSPACSPATRASGPTRRPFRSSPTPRPGCAGWSPIARGRWEAAGWRPNSKAAQQAARAGIAVIIARLACRPHRLDLALECGTLILPTRTRLRSRKHWIAFALRPAGALTVDPGAAEALRKKGRSLLPSGIREVAGEFKSGDCVNLLDHEGVEFGRGLVNYPAADILKVKGRRSNEHCAMPGSSG